jgi:hypothetical protein
MPPNVSSSLPREVFLSHATPDRAFVDRFVRVLRGNGVPVWYSVTNIIGAQQWHDEIGMALERCDWFALVLSPAALKSKWVRRELQFALNDDRYVGKIVPVLRKSCEFKQLSWTLPSFQVVDFTSTFDDGCRELLRTWGLGLAK